MNITKYMTIYNLNILLSNLPMFIFIGLIMMKKIMMIVGLLITTILCHGMKYLTNLLPMDSLLYKMTRRPESGLYCGISCIEGKTKKHDPGFPSGHTLFITFFSLCLPNTILMNMLKFTLICLVSFNRIITKCHTYIQVFGGLFFGYVMNTLLLT